jgi:hypothetical protein
MSREKQPGAKKPGQRNDDWAGDYEESYEPIDPSDMTVTSFRYGTYDIVYWNQGGKQTVRAPRATTPYRPEGLPGEPDDGDGGTDECVTFFDGGRKFAYHPEQQRLYSMAGDRPLTLAEGDDIWRIKRVDYPPGAPVVGGAEEGVTATVWYKSERSGSRKSFEMDVSSTESECWRITGERVSDGARVEVVTRGERFVTAKHYGRTGDVVLGPTLRVEFPPGHRFTVDLVGLRDSRTEMAVEAIERALPGSTRLRHDDIDIDVQHEGRIPDD